MKADSWPAKETLRLAKLKDYDILDTPPEPAYDDMTALAADICKTPIALVSLIDSDRQWFKAKVGLNVPETPREVAFCDHTIHQSDLLIVEDACQDARFARNPLVTGAPYIRFYAGAPLVTADGHALGSLCVIDYQPRKLTAHQRQGLQILSRHVVAQMELSLQAKLLKLANDHLEQRVNERTAGLALALNRLLKAQNKLLKREAALRHSALHDPLTGLPNRSYFLQRLEQAIQLANRQPKHLYAVLFIDLDNFKPVNDTLGHEVGDQLLQQVADQIKQPLRKSDLVARLGGDEFAVLLDDIPNEEHAIVVVQRLQAQLKYPFTIGTQQIFTSASVGITFSSQGYRQPEAAIRDADIAMYQAKKQSKAQLRAQILGKQPAAIQKSVGLLKSPIFIQDEQPAENQQFAIFDAAAQNRHEAKQLLGDELRQALLQNQFQLYYQPIFDLKAASVFNQYPDALVSRFSAQQNDTFFRHLYGFEVLLRWHHPRRGYLSAEEFIEVAEEIGIIRQLCNQIIHTACRQLAQWRRYPGCDHLSIHLNLSTVQALHADFWSQWETELAEYSFPPSACHLEIKEQVLLSRDLAILAALKRIKTLGVGLCVDDFGRGYSSLSRLHQLNVSALKIDRAFVEALPYPEGLDIVKTIIDLGRSAEMTVIAEGIETPSQLKTLIQLGCRFGQGFWLTEPLAAIAINEILQAS